MAAKRTGLGRGLSALMAEMDSASESGRHSADSGMSTLAIGRIDANPEQPRRSFDDAGLQELADSIRTRGVLQPILVKPVADGRYQIVAGERRWRACQLAGLHEIPAIIRDFSDADSYEAAIIENVQRSDLNPVEESLGYWRLISQFGHTQEMVAAATGKSRSHIANILRLLDLPEPVRELLQQGLLTVGHAKAVLQAREPESLARKIIAEGLTVRQAEEAARASQQGGVARRPVAPAERNADLVLLEDQLQQAIGVQVSIKARGDRGTVTLGFSDIDQLDAIIGRLQG